MLFTGNMDIICNLPGIMRVLEAMDNWSAKDEFFKTSREDYKDTSGKSILGYHRTVGNLTEFVVRGAGHLVARDKPREALFMLHDFLYDRLK